MDFSICRKGNGLPGEIQKLARKYLPVFRNFFQPGEYVTPPSDAFLPRV